MHIVATQVDKAVVLKVSGRMDAENADEFDKACDAWSSKGSKNIIADLADLQYVSSMGLRSFLSAAQKLKAASGLLMLVGLHGLPLQVFEMTKLSSLFPMFESTQKALDSL